MVEDLGPTQTCCLRGGRTDQDRPAQVGPFIDIRLRGRFENGLFVPESSGARDDEASA